MNVTIACDVLGEANNGTTIATLNFIRYLIKKGHNVKVISNDFGNCDIPEENQCLLPTLDLGSLANKIIAKNGVSLAKIDNKVLFEAIESADVVHIQFPLMIGRAAVKIAKHLDKPITASFHCQAENVSTHVGMQNNLIVSKAIYKDFYLRIYKDCDCVHYPTVFIKKTFEKACHHKTNAFVISNGVNTIYANHHLEKKNEKFTIASTGRLSHEKAQDVLIKAVSMSKYKDKIALKFAGEGPLLEKYTELAQNLGVDANFSFYSRTALVDLLNSADLYVHSAFIEIEAISCIEAICCGLVPVISNAKRSATKAFALDEKSLFTENSPKDLAKKIDYWIEHPEEKAEYVKKYEVMSRQFEQEECMKQMEEMLIEAKRIH
mgnify:CR=1 FL=1